ncbi:hypothetical protein NMG60_11018436 [Bertholletia excelsa]
MTTVQVSHADLESGSGGGDGHSASVSGGGSDRRSSSSSEAGGCSELAPRESAARGSSYGEENGTSGGVAASEIVGGTEKRKESSASERAAEADLEAGIAEVKVHLGKTERGCRICHLSFDLGNHESGVPIELGCSCKDDLAAAHKQCAEAWFKIKGNRTCEICGSTACNVVGPNEGEMMDHWNEANEAAAVTMEPLPSSETRNFWQGHRFLNFLLACMVFAFVISWLFHFNVPS